MKNNRLYRNKTLKRLKKKFNYLGKSDYNPIKFMNYRVLATVLVFTLFLVFSDRGYILGTIFSILVYALFEYYIDYKIKKRREILNSDAIFFFQVLVLTLEAGKNLQGGIELACRSIDSEFSREFKQTLDEVKLGKTLTESLSSMKDRIPSEEINTVLLNITQSSIFGNNIIESLNNQIDYLSDKKMLNIKATINKMPMKVSVISVVFIIPIIMLLILGPVLINYLLK